MLMCTVKGAAQIFARLPASPHEMQKQLRDELRQEFGLPAEARMAMHHFDLELREHLQETKEHGLQGCYVWPPVGLYAVHPSGCDPTYAGPEGRPADWSAPWVAPGTRRSEDPKKRERYICRFAKGGDKWVCPVNLDTDDDVLDWKSFWSSDAPRPVPWEAPGEPTAPGVSTRKRGKGPGAAPLALADAPAQGASSSAGEPTALAL